MTENEYVLLSNLAKLRSAAEVLRTVLPGKSHGITEKELSAITVLLHNSIDKVKEKIKIDCLKFLW